MLEPVGTNDKTCTNTDQALDLDQKINVIHVTDEIDHGLFHKCHYLRESQVVFDLRNVRETCGHAGF